MSSTGEKAHPHALMFPLPSQSHINPMLQLAKLLLNEGFFITFVNTEYNHHHIFQHSSSQRLHELPNLRFEQIADGLPPSHMRVNEKGGLSEWLAAILALPGPFVKLVRRIVTSSVDHMFPPLTCIIADSFCSWMQDIANQFHIPRVALWTTPVHANLAYTFQSTLASQGLIPVTDKSKLAAEFHIEGMVPMKLEDYISFFLADTGTDFLYLHFAWISMKRPEEALWNLGNNVQELENEAVHAFKKVAPNFLPIGPLLPPEMISPAQLFSPDAVMQRNGIASLLPEDSTCADWLSQHNAASVIYISFGSIVNMPEEELAEFILGLEESMAPFLWAVRPDQAGVALSQLRNRLDAEASANGKRSQHGLMVSWAPQLAALRHPSVGLFLSHCGWNSIMESLVAGVPILAKPGGFAEQNMNALYIEEVWKVGLRLPLRATAAVVKSHICTLLGSSPVASNLRDRVGQLRQRVTVAAVAGSSSSGSSYSNFRLFIDDMRKRASAQCCSVSQLLG